MTPGICELLWMKIILDDLKIKYKGPMKLYCDNKSAINMTHSRLITIVYVHTEHQLEDVLTRACLLKGFINLLASWE
ncbi:hypothetical protein CR513_02526, partial [Mucuna pruriens]